MNNEAQIIDQAILLNKALEMLNLNVQKAQKRASVWARKAIPGEKIETVTADGFETLNQASDGDFIVQNSTEAGEKYIVPATTFEKKYIPGEKKRDDWQEFRPKTTIFVVELTAEIQRYLGLPDEFHFTAPWNEPMIARTGDFLAIPEEKNEVYRIARKEFFETYHLI